MIDKNTNQNYLDTMHMIALTIDHETRNTLSLAQASLDCILLDDKEKKYSEFCELIKKALYRIANNATLYDYIRKPNTKDDEIVAYKFIFDIVRKYEVVNPQIKFSIICPSKSLRFISDRKKLAIVLSNIIKNAVESIGSVESGAIIIEFLREGSRDILICTDNSCGISKENLYKLNNGICFTTKQNGHGFGLYICRYIINELGGTLTLKNGKKGGFAATISLEQARNQTLKLGL